MKTFSTATLEYDCPECAAVTKVEIQVPDFATAVPTYFACGGCGQKNILTVGLEPDERKTKGS